MRAYLIAELEVTDPARYDEYGRRVLATIEKFGGRFVVRGGSVEALEGGWQPARLVMVEFPSLERARAWYRSPEYAPLIKLRQKASKGRLVIVEGA